MSPKDVLCLCDDVFYELVEKLAGSGEAKLLKLQGIRSVYSFWSTDDVFAILLIPCQALRDARSLVRLEADNQTFIVKRGSRSNITYLHQLVREKHEEHMKEINSKSKRNKESQSQPNSNLDNSLSQHSIQGTASPSSHPLNATTFSRSFHLLRLRTKT